MLSQVKVLDFTTLLPGPFATMVLADLGAEIIRIESPDREDLLKTWPPFNGDTSCAHQYINRSKKSMGLDLKQGEAIEIIKKLITEYDVIIEQFRPGVMDRLGLGYEMLKKINPRLIYCSITGYGQNGPYANRAGHDNNYLSIAGINSYSGQAEKGPVPQGVQIADVAGGSLHGVIGLLACIYHRERTGEGQHIDVSMTDAAFSLNTLTLSAYLGAGIEPGYEKSALNGGAFYNYYETSDRRYISVGSLEPKFFKSLCSAIARPDLLGLFERSPDNSNSTEINHIKAELSALFKTKSLDKWSRLFSNIDACVEPVLTISEAINHPQLVARKMVVNVPDANGSLQKQVAHPIKYSGRDASYKHVGVSVGKNTQEILSNLGYKEESINILKETKVVN